VTLIADLSDRNAGDLHMRYRIRVTQVQRVEHQVVAGLGRLHAGIAVQSDRCRILRRIGSNSAGRSKADAILQGAVSLDGVSSDDRSGDGQHRQNLDAHACSRLSSILTDRPRKIQIEVFLD
jgi:hypothetical protein